MDLFFWEQGNSSSPEADLRSLNHPPRGLPAHLGGYPIYPVTGKHNPSCVGRELVCWNVFNLLKKNQIMLLYWIEVMIYIYLHEPKKLS